MMVCAGVLAVGVPAAGVLAQHVSAAMLDRFEPGEWELRERQGDGPRTRLCIDSGRQLIQVRHQNETCRSVVVEDTATIVTVSYTCPRNGYGRTRLRFENPRLAQLDTRGIAQGLPFEFSAEARRIGSCTH